jgi:hypothetical protein
MNESFWGKKERRVVVRDIQRDLIIKEVKIR